MKVKASLHLHTHEDQEDCGIVDYTLYELIDLAASKGFKVLASTGHKAMVCRPEFVAYAKTKGILLIPGIELSVNHRHILMLDCDESANSIKDFEKLVAYKKSHPQCFVMAPHPNHRFGSLGLSNLKRYAESFDAIEHSWHYTKTFDPNFQSVKTAKELGLPLVATSDLHTLDYLDTDYAVVEVKELTATEVFKALKAGKFKNVSQPKTIREFFGFHVYHLFREVRHRGIFYSIFKILIRLVRELWSIIKK